MKINSTTILTLSLLLVMVAAGAASGMWGYKLGHEALKGVSQPDMSPTKKLAQKNSGQPGSAAHPILLREEDILKQVEAAIKDPKNAKRETNTTKKPPEEGTKKPSETRLISLNQSLPLSSQAKGVTFELVNSKQEDDSLVLEVNLKNEGDTQVRFLYSFLEVRDEKGRALSAITDGLPGELPPDRQTFSGTVKIPLALLEEAQKLSLTLTNYPDRDLKLSVSEIPLSR